MKPVTRIPRSVILVTLGMLLLVSVALAQTGGNFDLSWSTVDGGGGTSSSGIYTVSGTIGQPDVGVFSGGPYVLASGFWAAVAVPPSKIVVNTNDPIIDPNDGLCSLIEAIIAANTDTASGSLPGECAAGSGADVISLAAPFSLYRLTTVDNTTDGPNGLPSITSEIIIRNNHDSAPWSFIDRSPASGTPDFRIFHVAATGNLTLDGVVVENGRGDDGGGIFNRGTVTLDDSQVIGNEADNNGGGIFNEGMVTLINSDILANEANIGGGIFNVDGTVGLIRSTVSNNTATVSGGGIRNGELSPDQGGTVIVVDSTISDNSATSVDGGGIDNINGPVTVTNSVISGNSSGRDGGGIDNLSGEVELTDSTVSGNNASDGGGILNTDGMVELLASTVSSNSANDDGGGIFNNGSGSTTRLTNSTVSGNSANDSGGGIYNRDGVLRVLYSTVAKNSADLGGAIFNISFGTGTVEMGGTILAKHNTGGNCVGKITSFGGYNLIEEITDACIFNPITGDMVGTSDNPIDPVLSQLQDNGGPTFTHGLMRTTDPAAPPEDSPAIDAIPLTIPCPSIDQRGRPRPADGNGDSIFACDIGAFERQEGETAIELISFTAQAGADHVTLAWETGTEVDNAGFNLHRATAAGGPYTKLNDALIPAEGDAVSGASYTYTDTDVVKGVTYYYKLEDVDIHGIGTFHGSVSATPSPISSIYLPIIIE